MTLAGHLIIIIYSFASSSPDEFVGPAFELATPRVK